ncbi:SDR family oxidoreductase/polysaccharide deacetylase family protein [Aspergillus chevalieri]|uniref:NodB homology domain-containing protein n=1 Tax=Aspergillus chevalieri TaxID=182096 RepID=A0A7R7ZLQ0_ASPCH|nr:uncharacterized protein ACHE_30675S [Aspergillus chevalieri]BCR86688.1 hypothetical protein ACHE_30675S [Aspergillus chevalieri]
MATSTSSFLGLNGLHVFVTGAAGGIGERVVEELLDQGCKVTALELRLCIPDSATSSEKCSRLNVVTGTVTDERSIESSISQATNRFGPINILIANAGITDENNDHPIWDMSLDIWEKTYQVNARGIFLVIKHFLCAAKTAQQSLGRELDNLAIVVTGTGISNGLIRRVNNEVSQLNSRARINAVALDDPEIITRTTAFLSSHRAAGHISGQCLTNTEDLTTNPQETETHLSIPPTLTKRNKIRIAISIDLDAVSGWLGTGYHPDNVLADYSAGFFAAKVGVPRLVRMLRKLNLADRCTWFVPGHSAESFPEQVNEVVKSGAEIGLHGYAHEGAYQLTPEQERDILVKCIGIATKLTGKRPVGYRAPLYQLRESTLDLLEEYNFEYDASLTDHDSQPFFAPRRPPLKPIDYSLPASSWMHPVPAPSPSEKPDRRPLVCIPCNYYMEDMTPMQFLPHVHNSQGYTDTRLIENMWKDRFLWIRENEEEPVFPVLMHPDTSGMAHVIGMMERFLGWLRGWERTGEVEFCQSGEVVRWWREKELSTSRT